MDSYTAEEPPVDSNYMREIGCASAGALAVTAWRRRRRCHSRDPCFPVVYAQQTAKNQAMCSLMSEVLLRKINEQYSGELRCCRNNNRRVRETIQRNKRSAENVSLIWHVSGNNEVSEHSTGSTGSPALLFSHCLVDESLVNAICDSAAQSGCFVAELMPHGDIKTSLTTIRRDAVLRERPARLSKSTPLFLVGDESVLYNPLLFDLTEKTMMNHISGIIIIASAKDDCTVDMGTRIASIGSMIDAPILVLDAYENDITMSSWMYNPNILAVQLDGGQVASKDTWIVKCVLRFVDAACRLRQTWGDVHTTTSRSRL